MRGCTPERTCGAIIEGRDEGSGPRDERPSLPFGFGEIERPLWEAFYCCFTHRTEPALNGFGGPGFVSGLAESGMSVSPASAFGARRSCLVSFDDFLNQRVSHDVLVGKHYEGYPFDVTQYVLGSHQPRI